MKKLHLLKMVFLLCALVVESMNGWADTETFTYSDYKGQGTSSSGSGVTMDKTDVSITNTKFYCGSSATYAQFYANGVTTITPASGVTITQIVLTASETNYNGYQSSGTITASTGFVSGSTSSTTVTWSGSATEAFTISNNKQIRWTTIVVTYTTGSGSGLVQPTFSPTAGAVDAGTGISMSHATADEIRYTTDGTDPTKTTGIVYSTPITINTATTFKAIAVKGDDVSSVVTASYTINVAAPTFSPDGGGVKIINGATVSLSSTGNTIYYTTNGTTPSNKSTLYSSPITVNGTTTIRAIAYDTYGNASSVVSRTYNGIAPINLPFGWAGGGKTTLTAIEGVEGYGLGSDYDNAHSPYLVKFDTEGDYIQIFTDAMPIKISMGVKMIGGGTTSKIKVQQSSNGVNFSAVEDLTISGSQNSILNLETTEDFASTTRVIKLLFNKGSNVGVGPITIIGEPIAKINTTYEWATFSYPEALDFTGKNTEAYIVTGVSGSSIVKTRVYKVPANTGLLVTGETDNINVTTDATEDVSENKLIAGNGTSIAYDANSGHNYVLGVEGGNAMFLQIVNGTPATVPVGKAYLALDAAPARALSLFDDEETTGVNGVKIQKADCQYFNLAGQRVAQPTKGLYIVNGKKVVIK